MFAEWSNFFVASAGAAAALTGLLFVGISINLKQILGHQALPARAAEALILLVSILAFSIISLMPREKISFTGYVFLFLGLLVWLIITRADIAVYKRTVQQYKRIMAYNILFNQAAVIPYFVGGIWIICCGEQGLYCIGLAFIISFIKAVLDAWVLLIEIMR
ncbi:hypothetical protein [Ferruginibacter sp.]